jgi:hypothetical protein
MLSSESSAPADRPWNSRWFLPAALGVAASAEFVTNRLAQPAMVTLLGVGAQTASLVTGFARFFLNLATVLGVMVLASLLYRATLPGGAASRPLGRLSVMTIGALLCGLATLLVIAPDSLTAFVEFKRTQWLTQLSGVCLAALVVVGLLAPPMEQGQPVRGIYKLGALFLLLPPLLLLETQWGLFTGIRALQRYGLLTLLYGPVLAVAALGAGALCMSTLPPRPRTLVPLFGALIVTTGMALLLNRAPNLTMRIIYMSFDLRLPPSSEAYLLYLLSLCAWVFTVLALFVSPRSAKVRGLGLLLIGLGGCQAKSLHQMLFYLSGLLCLVESLLDSHGRQALRRRARAHSAAHSSMPSSAA